MKKFILLISILALALGLFAADVIIGTGTSVQRFPLGSYWGFERSAALYTAAEVGPQNSRISAVQWYTSTATNVAVPTKIYMKSTGAATLTSDTWANMISGATLVYHQTQTGLVAGGWNLFTLDNTFDLDMGNNLIILVERNYGGYGNGNSAGAGVNSTSFTGRHLTWNADTTPPTGTGSTSSLVPNVTLTYTTYTLDTPPNPAFIGAPANNATGVGLNPTLIWSSGGGGPTGYDVYFNGSLVSPNQAGLTYLPGPLTYSTTYTWQIIPRNDYGVAVGCPVWSFTTMADPTQPLPYLQDFNSGTNLTAIGWSGTFSIIANHGTSGSNGLSLNLYSSVPTATATTCPIGPLAPDSEILFDYRYVLYSGYPGTAHTLGTGDQLQIQVSTDGVTFDTLHTIDMNNHFTSTDFAPVTINLSAYSGNIFVRFDAARGTGDYYLDIDNVLVREVPAGAPGAPTLLSPLDGATGLSKYGFNLSWTPSMTGGTPTSYDVYMGSDPETMFDDGEVFTGIIGTSFNPVLDGGISFEYNDLWYWTVVAINAEGDALQETPFSFRIEQDPTVYVGPDTPWTEGFEGATFPPFGWTMNDADSDGQNWFLYNFEGTAHTGTNSAASASWTSSSGALSPDNWLITPPIAIPATGEYLMEYYVGAQDPNYPQDHYGLYISTTGTAPADFSLLFEETLMDGNWYFRSQNLGAYAGETVHFAFRHFDSYDWFYMKIDDVTVRELPEMPVFSYTPEEWDFGSVELLNPTTPKGFVLANVGAETINIYEGDIQLNQTGTDFILVAENLPAELSGANSYTFTVQFIPQSLGPKTATVTIEDNITREIHTITLSGEGIEEPIASVIALQGAVETQVNVRLNWASVYGDPTQAGYVHWDDATYRGNVGAGASPFHTAVKFGTEVTSLAAGKVLDGVLIHIADVPETVDTLKVWTGTDDSLVPTAMVHQQAVSDLTIGWNYIGLTTPIPVVGTEALFVGYHVTGIADTYPASTDGLTAVNGRGNVLELSGTWNTLTAYSIAGNWLIHAHFADAARIMAGRRPVVLQNVAVNNVEMTDEALRNSPVKARMNGNVDRVIRGFNVYRDGVQINSEIVAAYTYLDEGLAADTYDYAAQAVHYSANGPISGTIPVTVDPPADPIALPFLEDWESASYETNLWSIGSSNWVMDSFTGNPAPSASFSWTPRVYDYNSILASYEFDATGIASVQLSFDLNLNNYDILAENTMTWEVWDGTAWNTLGSYSSLDDDLGWTTYAYDLSAYAANRVFKIRFVAAGEDSYSINYWNLDNIYLAFLPATMDPITDLSISTDGLTIDLNWTAVPNATWYMIYASEDPYGIFLPLGFVPTAGASLPTSALPTDKAFVKVTAGTGPFPAGRNLSE